ncbi:hypothetical protein FA15DRAFT_560737, partial [Coprinopsis marcescibilis]
INQLQGTSVGFLFTESPVHSSSQPPDVPIIEISPVKRRMDHKLEKKTYSREEVDEMLALKQAETNYWKGAAIHQQAALVLNCAYTGRLRQQLGAKEDKGSKKVNKRLFADGKAQVLTQPELIQRVAEMEQKQQEIADNKANRAVAKDKLADQVAEWKVREKDRVKENMRRKELYDQAMVKWRAQRADAKARGQKL